MPAKSAHRQPVKIYVVSAVFGIDLDIRRADFEPAPAGASLPLQNERCVSSDRFRHRCRITHSEPRGKTGIVAFRTI